MSKPIKLTIAAPNAWTHRGFMVSRFDWDVEKWHAHFADAFGNDVRIKSETLAGLKKKLVPYGLDNFTLERRTSNV